MARPSKRKFFVEALEPRRLMAADMHFAHNYASPEDTDASGFVSPMDALNVINVLNSHARQCIDPVDVNGDGSLTPMDVLTVVNHLNRSQGATSDKVPSSVGIAARIARIEADLANGSLPTGMTVDRAQSILHMLKLGGSPELGDRVHEHGLADRLAELNHRLTELGVDATTVETVIASVQEQLDAGETNFRTIVNTALADAGIDLQALIQSRRQQKQIDHIADRLEAAGVDQSIVDQISQDMQNAFDAGEPLTREQLADRLTELGVDPATVFGRRTHGHDEIVSADEVAARLPHLGVDATVIALVVAEIQAAADSGSPMTRYELLVRLKELGIVHRDPAHRPSDPPRHTDRSKESFATRLVHAVQQIRDRG